MHPAFYLFFFFIYWKDAMYNGKANVALKLSVSKRVSHLFSSIYWKDLSSVFFSLKQFGER